MTRKEYFQLLLDSADNGTFPSVNISGSCFYRGPDNKKCAIGLLIKDEDYSFDMEMNSFALFLSKVNVPDQMSIKELGDIQHIHDTSAAQCRYLGWSSEAFKSRLCQQFPKDIINQNGEYHVA